MPNVGLGELMVIILIGLLVFGPNKLPEMMRSVGKAFRAFQAEAQKAANVIKEGVDEKPAAPAAGGVVDKPDVSAPPVPSLEIPKPVATADGVVGETAAETVLDTSSPITAADPTRTHEDT